MFSNNIMYTFFYSNISELTGELEVMLDKGTYKTSIQNMRKLGRKSNYFKSSDISMLGHGCGVSHYPYFMTELKKWLPRPYVGRYSGEKSHQFWQEDWII